MDAIAQMTSGQTQSLAALFLSSATQGTKDIQSFGKELAKQIDDVSPVRQGRIGKPENNNDKKDGERTSQSRPRDIELSLVVPVMAALNLTRVNTAPVVPINPASVANLRENSSAAPSVSAAMRDTVAPAIGGEANDVPAHFGAKTRCLAAAIPGELADMKGSTGPIEKAQTANPTETQQTDAGKGDHWQSVVQGGKEADTPAADSLLKKTEEPQRDDSAIAEKVEKSDISPRSSGEVHEKKKAGSEHPQTESVKAPEAAAPPTEQAEAPAPLGALAQQTPSIPIVTDSGGFCAAAEEIKASGLKGIGPREPKAPVGPLQLKQNDGKSASPVEDPKAIKDRKDALEDSKRVEQHDGGATAQAGTQPDEQVKQAFAKVNAEKAQVVLPGMHPAVSASSVPAIAEHSSATQPPQAGQTSAPEIAPPVSTPVDVVHAVRMFERNGQAEMHIGVRSETLGTIDVKATVHDGSVGVSIGVERHDVRSALVSELPGLENTLRDHDLRLGEVRFHDTGSTLASEYGNGRQPQSQDYSRPPASAFYRAAKSSSESNDLPVEMVTTIARGGISVHV